MFLITLGQKVKLSVSEVPVSRPVPVPVLYNSSSVHCPCPGSCAGCESLRNCPSSLSYPQSTLPIISHGNYAVFESYSNAYRAPLVRPIARGR